MSTDNNVLQLAGRQQTLNDADPLSSNFRPGKQPVAPTQWISVADRVPDGNADIGITIYSADIFLMPTLRHKPLISRTALVTLVGIKKLTESRETARNSVILGDRHLRVTSGSAASCHECHRLGLHFDLYVGMQVYLRGIPRDS